MWIKWMAIIGVLIIVSLGIAAIYGSYRWQSDTDKLRARLINGRQVIKPQIYDQKELEGLPEPVQRFFRTVLKDGQAITSVVKLSQQGQFNMSETEDKCLPIGDNIDKDAIAPLTCSEGTSKYLCSCSKLRCPEIF